MGHVLPKKEMVLRKGQITIKVGDRVTFEDYSKIGKYQEVSKWFRQQIKKTYNRLAASIETADYWENMVKHNYIYKGFGVERKVRKNLQKQNNYKDEIEMLKDARKVKIVNCGYGEFPLLASLFLKDVDIYAFENDKEKFSIAQNCIGVSKHLHYVENVEDFDIECDYEIDMKKLSEND